MKANAEGIKTLTGHSELIVAAPLGDLTDDEFRKTLIQEGVKLAGSEGQVFVKKHNLTLMFWVKFRKTVERLSEFHADEFESCSAYGIRAVSEYNGLASSFFEFLLHEPCKLNCREETCCRMLQIYANRHEILTILAKWRGLRGLVNNAGVGLFTDLLEGDSVERVVSA